MKRTCCLHNCGCCKLLLIISSSEPRASNGNEEENGKTEKHKKQKKSAFVFTAALTDVRRVSLVRQIPESGVTSLKQKAGGSKQGLASASSFLLPHPPATGPKETALWTTEPSTRRVRTVSTSRRDAQGGFGEEPRHPRASARLRSMAATPEPAECQAGQPHAQANCPRVVRIARRTRRELGGRLWVTGTKAAVTQNTWTRVLKEFNTAAT